MLCVVFFLQPLPTKKTNNKLTISTLWNILLFTLLLTSGCGEYKNNTIPSNINTPDTVNIKKHIGVHAAFFNPTGTKCAISTDNGQVVITDTLLNVIENIKSHIGSTTSSFFSHNGEYIVTGGTDNSIKVWDVNNFELLKEKKVDFPLYTSVFGTKIYGGCGEGGNIILFDWQGDSLLYHLKSSKDGAYFLYLFDGEKYLLVAAGEGRATEWNMQTGHISMEYKGHKDKVFCTMPSPDLTKVITASADSTVIVWDRKTGKLLHQISDFEAPVYVSCFSPDGKRIAACTTNGKIHVFQDYTKILEWQAFDGIVNTIHYSPNGNMILAGSEASGARMFNASTGSLIAEWKESY